MKYFVLIILIACSTHKSSVPKAKKVVNTIVEKGWDPGVKPTAPADFEVIRFANGLKHPVWAHETPGGDVLVSETDQVTLLRDTDGDGKPELKTVLISDLNHPSGIEIVGNWIIVATVDGIWRWPYTEGVTSIKTPGEKIADLPVEGNTHHWMRNLIVSQDGTRIYVSVGSDSDHGEAGPQKEVRRANVLIMNPDGKNEKIYASGLRNPVGMDWHSHTGQLWVTVTERDNLGDQTPEDYLTVIKQNHFYGWPYYYFGKNKDPRWKGKVPKKLPRVAVPHLKLGAHTGSIALTFYRGKAFGPKYRSGAFISQYGSENSSKLVGYKVVFVPFSKGFPAGPPEDFLTGFIADEQKGQVHGRPAGLVELNRGDLLVCDETANTIWLVRSKDAVSSF